MYAVRLETSPAAGSSTNVVIMNLPDGNSEIGPRSMSWNVWPSNDEATSSPTGGTVTTPPISAPSPSVAPSRKRLRGKRSPASGSGIPAGPAVAGGAGPVSAAGAGGGGGGATRTPAVRSRTHRNPNTSAITPPTATAGQLTIRPTRTHATPTAKPTGQRVGDGRCGLSSPRWGSTFVVLLVACLGWIERRPVHPRVIQTIACVMCQRRNTCLDASE